MCAFAPVFSEKSAIFSAKVAKTWFLAFLSTGFLALELALFQQFVDDAGSLDGKTQAVVQSAKDDSATRPLQHHQFETPVDCTHDVAMYSMPASPHDRDVMHKARGVM